MLPPYELLKEQLRNVIACKAAQGHEVTGLHSELRGLPDSYDALAEFGRRLSALPIRADWRYVEPNGYEEIMEQCSPDRPEGYLKAMDEETTAGKVRAAFYGAVAGCILGKPLEVDPTLDEIRAATEPLGQWPIDDYVSIEALERLGRRHRSAWETTRGNIAYVAADDDINYDIVGMEMIEDFGVNWTQKDLCEKWLSNLPVLWTWGPERCLLVRAGMATLAGTPEFKTEAFAFDRWTSNWNPNDEACGAAIRVDAYAYACAGNPALAAEMAWRDAAMTHSRTGIYGAMFVGAALAAAFAVDEVLDCFRIGLQFVPRRSRFHEIVADSLEMVETAGNWLEGYRAINGKYGEYRHCRIYQESALLINSAKFAGSVDDAFCKQVMQGCDTDCYGEIIGSIMGAFMGPEHLDPRWLEPFNDTIHTTLATFREQRLSAVADRMARLPGAITDGTD